MLEPFPTKVLPEKGEDANDELTTQLVEDMHLRWLKGECPRVEEYLERHPELRESSDALLRIIYEEYCIRREAGEDVRPAEYMNRFPKWQHRLKPLLECHQLLVPELPSSDELSRVAQCGGEFRVVGELGKGSEGQVFLAMQMTLADRPVVLKVSPAGGEEHLTLARLQHTHIVPLYGLHEDPLTHFRILCMPFMGGATLEQLLDHLRPIPVARRTGKDVLHALDKMQTGCPVQVPTHGPARALLARLDFTHAMCWMSACLAEALAFAHQRDLIHLDVKPSNILITADAQPMLLDFHIAQKPVSADNAAPAWIGGTPRFASPEQLSAMSAMSTGSPLKEPVDCASDLYSLGLVLYKSLGGDLPIPDNSPPPRLEKVNRQVSIGLGDVLEKCLQPRPADRYLNAQALAEDLRRHLKHQALQGVANRSWKERWRKWRTRRPHALHLALMLLAVLGAAVSFGVVAFSNIAHDRREAKATTERGEEHFRRGNHALAREEFQRALTMCASLPGTTALKNRLDVRLNQARRLHEAEQLHQLVDRLRYLAGSKQRGSALPAFLEEQWRDVWARRGSLLEPADADMNGATSDQLRNDLHDLALLWADAKLRGGDKSQETLMGVWTLLRETKDSLGEGPLLMLLMRDCALALGKTREAEDAGRNAATLLPKTAWEQAALGRTLLTQGKVKEARTALERAVKLQPDGFWTNFYLGTCAFRQGDHEEAISSFRVCLALSPRNSVCHFNRSMALAALGRSDEAIQDLTRALEIDPNWGDAYVQRAIVHRQAKHFPPALADLKRALTLETDKGELFFQLAQVYRDMGQPDLASQHAKNALTANPAHAGALDLSRELREAKSP